LTGFGGAFSSATGFAAAADAVGAKVRGDVEADAKSESIVAHCQRSSVRISYSLPYE
jgi:hypothetical protein